MTIDEAIKHCEEAAEEKESEAKDLEYSKLDWRHEAEQCSERAEEHRQIAEWLKELKQLRKIAPQPKKGKWIRVDKDKCKCDQCEVIAFIGLYPNGDKNYCPNCGAQMQEVGE